MTQQSKHDNQQKQYKKQTKDLQEKDNQLKRIVSIQRDAENDNSNSFEVKQTNKVIGLLNCVNKSKKLLNQPEVTIYDYHKFRNPLPPSVLNTLHNKNISTKLRKKLTNGPTKRHCDSKFWQYEKTLLKN